MALTVHHVAYTSQDCTLIDSRGTVPDMDESQPDHLTDADKKALTDATANIYYLVGTAEREIAIDSAADTIKNASHIETLAQKYSAARADTVTARAQLQGAVLAIISIARARGMHVSEKTLAEKTSLSRGTIRRLIGKL